MRHELLPLLERDYNPNIRQVLGDAAELARAEEEYWQALVERELEARQRTKAEGPRGQSPVHRHLVTARLKPCPFKAARQSHASVW